MFVNNLINPFSCEIKVEKTASFDYHVYFHTENNVKTFLEVFMQKHHATKTALQDNENSQ